MATPDNTVSLVVKGTALAGWEDVRLTRRCQGLPNEFELTLSSFDPVTGSQVAAQCGDPVQIRIGSDLVLTGYVDTDGNDATPDSHALSLAGRGKCCDLVDCSAQWPGGLINAANILQLAGKLGAPYGITASAGPQTDTSVVIPELALNYGETAAEIIGRVARNVRVLYYEGTDGNLILSQVGTTKAASGVAYGQNAQRWSVRNSMAERYSDIYCAQFSTSPVYDQGAGAFDLFGHQPDANVSRHRVLIIVTDGLGAAVANAKAQWEIARRAGRGQQLAVTVDSWRDAAGTLWTPNTLIPCSGPGLRPTGSAMLCVSEVTYRLDNEAGEVADLVLMPPAAFSPEPIQLLPPENDVTGPEGSGSPVF